jgi:hypothetical protein
MPPVKQRPPSSVAVSKAAIAQATTVLNELPAKAKESWSLREAVTMLQDSITTALDRGYSYEEVSTMLAGKGVSITASSLKRYLANAKKKADGGATASTGKRGRKPRAAKSEDAAPAATETATSEATPTKRRGRGPNKPKPEGAEAKPKATRTAAARKTTATKIAASEKSEAAPIPSKRGRKKASAE